MMRATFNRGKPMQPTDEELMHAYYGGNSAALDSLAARLDPLLARAARDILTHRTGSPARAGEWDIDDRLSDVWASVENSKRIGSGGWPHARVSVLTWLLYLLGTEMDRHLGRRPPF